MSEEIRLNKYLGEMGVCSRREADRLIEAGKVTVDGVTASMGLKVRPGQQVVCDGRAVGPEISGQSMDGKAKGRGDKGSRSVDGKATSGEDAKAGQHFVKAKPVLLIVNKPRGIVCTTSDKDRAVNIVEFLKYPSRIYPVGRLDKDSEGLLLMTNQGDLVNKIMRAGNAHEKEYVVTVDKPVTREFLKAMSEGVAILDTVTRPCKIRATGKREFTMILTQGLNRQIRRMCEALGYQVRTLKRVRIMNLRLGNLKTGGYRKVTPAEYRQLLELLEGSSNISPETEEYDDVGVLIGKERLDGKADSQNERISGNSDGGR